ncbi:hypothetical protein KOY48_05000 [Candidatus Minimicrobia naudis]|uniref:Pyridine nucleotide-disulphide oxidoreductase dimerisation domain-containing protein n=1 Tax=Candidatus Minimicrobia naudis TaxID=2841263 RepID=A0A8F1MC71_9BACT|nr:hypothetical protein KOY48_05000 [Candidatus Minimicrobia naudis]
MPTNNCPKTDLGLENAGVKYTENGILVNSYLQTSARHIFAAGNVTDTNIQTHTALKRKVVSRLIICYIIIRLNSMNPHAHKVAFTQPEIAQIGNNEYDCKAKGISAKIAIVPLTTTVRSNITDQRIGFVKLIVDKKRVIIGGTIVGPHASDIAAEPPPAVRHKITSEELASTPHCFTSWSEAVRIAAGKLL